MTKTLTRLLCAYALTSVLSGCNIERRLDLEPATAEVASVHTEQVTLTDGTHLATDVYLPGRLGRSGPELEGPFPTIIVRTPYSRAGYPMYVDRLAKLITERGFAVVMQDVRGRFDSEGHWAPLVHEYGDSADTVKWTLAQPWCDGSLGLLGASYLTITAWAAADQFPEAIKAMVLNMGSTDIYSTAYVDGMLRQDVISAWVLAMRTSTFKLRDVRHYDRMVNAWPPSAGDAQTVGNIPFYQEVLDNPRRGVYWTRDFKDPARTTQAATLMVTGWYDFFMDSQLKDWARLNSQGSSALIVGPWTHVWGMFERPAIDLGPDAGAGFLVDQSLDWFEQHLMEASPRKPLPKVRTWAFGQGWTDSTSWPPPQTHELRLYLSAEAGKKACRGDGALTASAETQARQTQFDYDPRDPVPTVGGALLGWVLGADDYPGGPQDQDTLCGRADIRTYVSEPLDAPLELAGPMGARLWVESTAEDTAFTVKLIDLPDGAAPAVNIQDGISTLSAQDSQAPHATPPGTVVPMQISLNQTHWVLPAGHRLRVDISSSNFPQFHRHPNVFGPYADVAEPRVATQTIHAGANTPSHIWLTVAP